MNKNKIKILFLGFVVLIGGLGFYQSAAAADASVYVSPASLSKNIGDIFNISVGVNPGGNKVCAVEGKLNLDKLSCLSITVADGVMAQSSPSCSNLYFLLGIPGCTTGNKTLFTVTVKAGTVGMASADFSGVDIIGEGVSVSSASIGGSYTLTSVFVVPASPSEETPPKEEVVPEEEPIEKVIPKEEAPEVVEKEPVEPKGLLAAIVDMPFSAKAILVIFGIIIIGLVILRLPSFRRKRG